MTESSNHIVCRCEEVTVETLEHAYETGAVTARQIKMKTRATMGACQGRVCRYLIDIWIHAQDETAPRSIEQLSVRQPIRPVTFGDLARGE